MNLSCATCDSLSALKIGDNFSPAISASRRGIIHCWMLFGLGEFENYSPFSLTLSPDYRGEGIIVLEALAEDLVEHLGGEFAGEGVLLADVVGGDQFEVVGQGHLGAVGEGDPAGDLDPLPLGEFEGGVPGDFSQGEDGALLFQELPFGVEVGGAVFDFGGVGVVGGRGAAGGGADVAVGEDQAVGAGEAGGLVG